MPSPPPHLPSRLSADWLSAAQQVDPVRTSCRVFFSILSTVESTGTRCAMELPLCSARAQERKGGGRSAHVIAAKLLQIKLLFSFSSCS